MSRRKKPNNRSRRSCGRVTSATAAAPLASVPGSDSAAATRPAVADPEEGAAAPRAALSGIDAETLAVAERIMAPDGDPDSRAAAVRAVLGAALSVVAFGERGLRDLIPNAAAFEGGGGSSDGGFCTSAELSHCWRGQRRHAAYRSNDRFKRPAAGSTPPPPATRLKRLERTCRPETIHALSLPLGLTCPAVAAPDPLVRG